MARVTVEDCVEKVTNRFELVMLASQRARSISSGAPVTLDRDNDKNPVVALREIAVESVELDGLRAGLIQGLQKHADIDEPEEEDVVDLLQAEQQVPGVVPSEDVAEPLSEAGFTIEGAADDAADTTNI